MRSANRVLHWERMVSDSSEGRCDTRPRESPYLRPSLALREMMRRVGPKPWPPSLGKTRTAPPQTRTPGTQETRPLPHPKAHTPGQNRDTPPSHNPPHST